MIPDRPQQPALCVALRLCALAVFAWWGFETGAGPVGKAVLGVGVPLAAAGLWATFVAPRRPVEVSATLRLLSQLAVFGGAAVALAALVAPGVATGFAAAAVLSVALTLRPRTPQG